MHDLTSPSHFLILIPLLVFEIFLEPEAPKRLRQLLDILAGIGRVTVIHISE